MKNKPKNNKSKHWRSTLSRIIFKADTRGGKLFDEVLIVCIISSVIVIMLDSVKHIHSNYGQTLYILEWIFTILFTIEYALRIISADRPQRYVRSFFGIIDLLAILPTYFSLFFPGTQVFIVIRLLRVLRIFRIFKLVKYISEAQVLTQALRASARKIAVFLFTVLTIVVVMGSLMYVIEGEKNGFTTIPRSIYWAIVTLTTVGYGDISPQTGLGQFLAAIIMICGYGIIAVPTGIVTVELSQLKQRQSGIKKCPSCQAGEHDPNARYCKFCGSKLAV